MNSFILFFLTSFFVSSFFYASDAQRSLPATVLPKPKPRVLKRIPDEVKNNTPKWVAPIKSPEQKAKMPKSNTLAISQALKRQVENG